MPKYRVTHGDIISGGKATSKGAEVEMSEADAAELGAAVELVPEVKPEKAEPKHETKPVTHSHEFRPAVEAKKPHAGKDKTK